MTDLQKAKKLLEGAGLPFPQIPPDLARRLKHRGGWCFSTRKPPFWPYDVDFYVLETVRKGVRDYALLSHEGHGINSWALEYFLVFGGLQMFLHLPWGGVYEDEDECRAYIRKCFSLADKIVEASRETRKLRRADPLTIRATDFYGSCWLAPGRRDRTRGSHSAKGRGRSNRLEEEMWTAMREGESKRPEHVLTEALEWLNSPGP